MWWSLLDDNDGRIISKSTGDNLADNFIMISTDQPVTDSGNFVLRTRLKLSATTVTELAADAGA